MSSYQVSPLDDQRILPFLPDAMCIPPAPSHNVASYFAVVTGTNSVIYVNIGSYLSYSSMTKTRK